MALKEQESAQPPSNARKKIAPRFHQIAISNPHKIFCNTDASWNATTRCVGLAWIFTNLVPVELLRGSRVQASVSSPCMGEALAIREALLLAASQNYSHICIRTDSQVLVQAISSCRHTMKLYGVLFDIDGLGFFFLFRLSLVVSFSPQELIMGQPMSLQKPTFQPMLSWV